MIEIYMDLVIPILVLVLVLEI